MNIDAYVYAHSYEEIVNQIGFFSFNKGIVWKNEKSINILLSYIIFTQPLRDDQDMTWGKFFPQG